MAGAWTTGRTRRNSLPAGNSKLGSDHHFEGIAMRLLPVLAAVCLACSSAFAADSPSKATDDQFKRMDANRDGKLSRDEHSAGARKMFEAMDADRDGRVSAAEMDAAQRGKKPGKGDLSSAEKIKVVDTDRDGSLSADEHVAGTKGMFDRMDTNRDGFLSPSELRAGHAKMLKK